MSFEQQWEEEGRKQRRREWEERIKRHNVRVNQKRILQAVKLKREKKRQHWMPQERDEVWLFSEWE